MGNSKSKKTPKEPGTFFEAEKLKEIKMEEKKKKKKKKVIAGKKRTGVNEAVIPPNVAPQSSKPVQMAVSAPPAAMRSYDDEAVELMRSQLKRDSEAFLLNNILLSVQFFENYEREVNHIKNNPISEREHLIDAAMVRHHKHVFFADRLQECVHDHVSYQRKPGQPEPLATSRLFIIYDNVEASEPGDTSDYSAVLDAPFYKLLLQDCKDRGYVKLKKLEVLESNLAKDNAQDKAENKSLNDSVYTDSEKESNASDEPPYSKKGKQLLQKIESKLIKSHLSNDSYNKNKNINLNSPGDISGRRGSGPVKQISLQAAKSNISNIKLFQNSQNTVLEHKNIERKEPFDDDVKPRKSILKQYRRPSTTLKDLKNKTQFKTIESGMTIGDDTETSGYRSATSSRNAESSENESDYGYATITVSTTPKKVELSDLSNYSATSGVLPDECWVTVKEETFDNWSDDEDDYNASKMSLSRSLYEICHYLGSTNFMDNFVDNFITHLGSGLGLSQNAIESALTQGASIYCDTMKNGMSLGTEVFPALIAAWPNAANQWIIRERKIIQNPRTNFSYQWPTRYMVRKAVGFGCLLIPVGFRPKRNFNPEQVLQWKIIFPAAERYLESCLAHSHMRCYLIALALQKTFLNNESSKIGIDSSHIKNHLFWQCEDNYAKWPEDRLGETLTLFLKTFYFHLSQHKFPNYFIESCNDFNSIPKPLLLKQQDKLKKIIESPVMHVLHALDKLKYNKKDFYPPFNAKRLYEILTCKNPLRLLNPNLPESIPTPIQPIEYDSSDSEHEDKSKDKHYLRKKEKLRVITERRRIQNYYKKQKPAGGQEKEINTDILLPRRMEAERRRLVLDFFISHFIAMARSSERFDAMKQAVIYLEQAQRLCKLLVREPGGDTSAQDYSYIIRDKLTDCHRKLINQDGFKLPPRRDSQIDRMIHNPLRKSRPRYQQMVSQDSPTEVHQSTSFNFNVDVHAGSVKLNISDSEDSKL